ncbi:MAG: aspartate aminotransferase family protein [Alphaproteobacteria bacterium]|nr:aspartate aminotransferase family protein [Alphaproteobacteria bacterium]
MSNISDHNFYLTSNNLEAFWMPFTANRHFKAKPRLFASAKGMYYTTVDNQLVLDAVAGLWCVNAGHNRTQIVEAVQKQIAVMDYAPNFNMGHPTVFELASRLANIAPENLDHVFFTNSGSEAVDTALKIALAYHRVCGESTRQRLIGRERGYHGVGFGGISVGGMVNNRKSFGTLIPGVDHIRHTHDLTKNAFTKGQPKFGIELADDLERLVALHDASTIAAIIVEPVAGSTGVLVPPIGYLKRLREICDKYEILLIFDEVITAFGRLGKGFAADYFDVIPDMITIAKGLTNGSIPMGAVLVHKKIYDAFMKGPENTIEFFHGYTYSGHPVAVAAGLATLDIYKDENLFERANKLSDYWQEAVHSLVGRPYVIDIRNIGLMAAIELQPKNNYPTQRAFEVFTRCYERGVFIRVTGDTLALSPPLIIEKDQIDKIINTISDVLLTLSE